MRIKGPDAIDVLVNKNHWLSKEYKPKDLVHVKVNFLPDTNFEAEFLRREAAKSLEKLFKKAKKAKVFLYAVSGFRSYERQSKIFKNNLKKDGELANKYSARAGQSEHQTGLAVDVTCERVGFSLSDEFENTEEYKWLVENSYKYGFIIRYPNGKEDVTGYAFEPWHLRYVGSEIAEEVYLSQLTLEELFSSDRTRSLN